MYQLHFLAMDVSLALLTRDISNISKNVQENFQRFKLELEVCERHVPENNIVLYENFLRLGITAALLLKSNSKLDEALEVFDFLANACRNKLNQEVDFHKSPKLFSIFFLLMDFYYSKGDIQRSKTVLKNIPQFKTSNFTMKCYHAYLVLREIRKKFFRLQEEMREFAKKNENSDQLLNKDEVKTKTSEEFGGQVKDALAVGDANPYLDSVVSIGKEIELQLLVEKALVMVDEVIVFHHIYLEKHYLRFYAPEKC